MSILDVSQSFEYASGTLTLISKFWLIDKQRKEEKAKKAKTFEEKVTYLRFFPVALFQENKGKLNLVLT